jgi:hypothetical protein
MGLRYFVTGLKAPRRCDHQKTWNGFNRFFRPMGEGEKPFSEYTPRMKSPFPGMDPYLEGRWGDVHTALCIGIRSALQPVLPTGLRARAQEDVLLEDESGPARRQKFEADIAVVETGDAARRASRGASIATVDPIVIRHIPGIERSRWVEIIDTTAGNRVVTAIEILSPGNKRSGKLNKRYRRKIDRYIEAGVNVVEIDLLRSSRARLAVQREELPPARRAPYLTCVCRTSDPLQWEVYPMPLREPLPTVPIPCRETDDDVALAVQPLIDQIYREGGHDDIDYHRPCEPPLESDAAAWATGLIHRRDGRSTDASQLG